MQADMREYVLSLLDNYKQTSREIALITYELQHFTGISPEDMIKVMSFAHKMENGILENAPRDVPSISFSYREFASRLNQEAANGIVTHLQELLQERDRLLHYVNLLEPRQRSVIISFYFHAKSWNQISSEQHIAIRTALKIRNIAIHELVRMYTLTYQDQVNRYLKPAFGATKLEDLDSHTIQKFYNSLQVSGLSAKTIKNIHGVLHSALQQAIANKYIRQNPSDACKLPKVYRPEITPLEPAELSVILDTAEKDAYCNLFIAAMFTGMRQGELLGLSWESVDFKNGVLRIKQQLQCKDGTYFLETPKNG